MCVKSSLQNDSTEPTLPADSTKQSKDKNIYLKPGNTNTYIKTLLCYLLLVTYNLANSSQV